MALYKKPQNRIHRGFFYLDDETVINSLSAVESGKIDEVVAKVVSAEEGTFGGSAGVPLAKIGGDKKATESLQEEMIRIRTRFSIFELWYKTLLEGKALGTFSGWGPDALKDVEPGDTIELRGVLEVAPLEVVTRQYFWFADKAKSQGHMFSQKGDELKETKDAERTMKMLMGDMPVEDEQVVVLARPMGNDGPRVVMPLKKKWMIGKVGQFGGDYTLIAQVDRLVKAGDRVPALRMTYDAPATELEITTIIAAIQPLKEASAALGVTVTDDDAIITGPALWLEPIAIFR